MITINQIKNKPQTIYLKIFISFLFIVYICILIPVSFFRVSYDDYTYNLSLFTTHLKAWYDFSSHSWMQIISNIIGFIPFGFMLPLLSKKFSNLKLTYIVSFLSIFFIECLQLITRRGIFDVDDILNNFIGAIIGYGLIMSFYYIFSLVTNEPVANDKIYDDGKINSQKIYKSLALINIPLLLSVIATISIFTMYNFQPLGNLRYSYNYNYDMSPINIVSNIDFSTTNTTVYTYETYIGDRNDTDEIADSIFKNAGTEVNDDNISVINNTVLYSSINDDIALVDKVGLTSTFSSSSISTNGGLTELAYDEIIDIFKAFSITLPSEGTVIDFGNGMYEITFYMDYIDNKFYSGTLSFTIGNDGFVSEFNNDIRAYDQYAEFDIISQKEAFDKILNGDFNYYLDSDSLTITDVNLIYVLDSKNFAQPVYKFTIIENSLNSILIPAIK